MQNQSSTNIAIKLACESEGRQIHRTPFTQIQPVFCPSVEATLVSQSVLIDLDVNGMRALFVRE